jgi:hypothetical protein
LPGIWSVASSNENNPVIVLKKLVILPGNGPEGVGNRQSHGERFWFTVQEKGEMT